MISSRLSIGSVPLHGVIQILKDLKDKNHNVWLLVRSNGSGVGGYTIEVSVETDDVNPFGFGRHLPGYKTYALSGNLDWLKSLSKDKYWLKALSGETSEPVRASEQNREAIARELKVDFDNWISKIQ